MYRNELVEDNSSVFSWPCLKHTSHTLGWHVRGTYNTRFTMCGLATEQNFICRLGEFDDLILVESFCSMFINDLIRTSMHATHTQYLIHL